MNSHNNTLVLFTSNKISSHEYEHSLLVRKKVFKIEFVLKLHKYFSMP